MAFSPETYGAVKKWTQDYVQGVIGSTGIKVGSVDQSSTGFPTTRADGSPLHKEDYVTVSSSATLPFTIDGITFTNKLDRVVWSGTVWGFSAGSIVESDEVSISNKSTESISGTETIQSGINRENVEELKRLASTASASANESTPAGNCVFDFKRALGSAMVDKRVFVTAYILYNSTTIYGHLETVQHYQANTTQITQKFYYRESYSADSPTLDIFERKGTIKDCPYNQIYMRRGQIVWQPWRKIDETSGLSLTDSANESIAGTSTNQSDVNKEVKTKITDIQSLINTLDEEYKKAGFTFTATTTTVGGIDTTKLVVKDKNGNNLLDIDLMGAMTGQELLDAIKDLPAELKNKVIDCGTFNP